MPVLRHIRRRTLDDFRVVFEEANAPIAVIAEQSAYLTRHVIVVNMPATGTFGCLAATNRTPPSLRGQHPVIVGNGKPVVLKLVR